MQTRKFVGWVILKMQEHKIRKILGMGILGFSNSRMWVEKKDIFPWKTLSEEKAAHRRLGWICVSLDKLMEYHKGEELEDQTLHSSFWSVIFPGIPKKGVFITQFALVYRHLQQEGQGVTPEETGSPEEVDSCIRHLISALICGLTVSWVKAELLYIKRGENLGLAVQHKLLFYDQLSLIQQCYQLGVLIEDNIMMKTNEG